MENYKAAIRPRQYGKAAEYEALAVDLAAALDRPVAEAEAVVAEFVEPWDCAPCIAGRGKGDRIGTSRYGWPEYGDKLCSRHKGRIPMPRNRAELRRLEHEYERFIRRQTRRLIRDAKARRAKAEAERRAEERAAAKHARNASVLDLYTRVEAPSAADRAWVSQVLDA